MPFRAAATVYHGIYYIHKMWRAAAVGAVGAAAFLIIARPLLFSSSLSLSIYHLSQIELKCLSF